MKYLIKNWLGKKQKHTNKKMHAKKKKLEQEFMQGKKLKKTIIAQGKKQICGRHKNFHPSSLF